MAGYRNVRNINIQIDALSVILGLENDTKVEYYIVMYAKYFIYRRKFCPGDICISFHSEIS